MDDLLHISAGERGTVRIFAVDIDAAERRKILEPKPDTAPTGAALGDLLGVDWIAPDHADLFDVADLDDLGLMGFLSQGAGISDTDLDAHRSLLDPLTGTVLIVYALGFSGEKQTLTPDARVRPVACLREAKAPIQFEPLRSAAAAGQLDQPAPVPKSPHLTVLLAILALPILALLIGAVLWALLQ